MFHVEQTSECSKMGLAQFGIHPKNISKVTRDPVGFPPTAHFAAIPSHFQQPAAKPFPVNRFPNQNDSPPQTVSTASPRSPQCKALHAFSPSR
jgi:hypothetical protein